MRPPRIACENGTGFGTPVVPLVKRTTKMSSSETFRCGGV